MATPVVLRLALLVASLHELVNSQACSKVDEECTKTGCCSTPFSACYKKNENVSFCRLGCDPGIHEDDPKEFRTWWSCELVTWGCNPAWKPCEGAVGQGEVVPCCQDGCVCNYTSKFFHQCVPPAGQTECSKDGPLKKPHLKSNSKSSSEADSEGADSEDEASEAADEGELADCIKVGGVMMCGESKAQILSDAEPLAPVDARLSLLAAVAAAASVVFALLGVVLWRGNRISARMRRHRSGPELGETLSDEESS